MALECAASSRSTTRCKKTHHVSYSHRRFGVIAFSAAACMSAQILPLNVFTGRSAGVRLTASMRKPTSRRRVRAASEISGCRVEPGHAVSGSWDGTLRLWNLERGEVTKHLEGHTGAVWRVFADWSLQRALSMSGDNTMRIWDMSEGVTVRELSLAGESLQTLSADWRSKQALSGHAHGNLRLWDLETGQAVRELRSGLGVIQCTAVDWSSRQALTALLDGSMQLWDLDTGNIRPFAAHSSSELSLKTGHLEQVTCLTVDWPSKRVLTASHDGAVRLWDFETGGVTLQW